MEQNGKKFMFASLFEKKHAVEKLIEEGTLTTEFYFLLVSSVLIITLGLVLNNSTVIIGGMLLTPLFSPLLIIGLGIVLSSKDIVFKNFYIFLKLIVVVVMISMLISLIVNVKEPNAEILLRTASRFEYFLVAFVAGIVGTYLWIKPHLQNLLSGIIVAVAIVPPLSSLGIGLSMANRDIVSGSLMFFVLNFIGIVFGSVLMFSFFGFGKTNKTFEKTMEKKLENINGCVK